MAAINANTKEIIFKIVYYGPGMSGKTTNLQKIHEMERSRGRTSRLLSLATEGDRTIFFDYMPISFGRIKGYSTKYQLYTVPGQIYYNATRKAILKGCDGIVFVADSMLEKLQENIESMQSLKENLLAMGKTLDRAAIVFQFNKRDCDPVLSVQVMNDLLNEMNCPFILASALKNEGVTETLKEVCMTAIRKTFSKSNETYQ